MWQATQYSPPTPPHTQPDCILPSKIHSSPPEDKTSGNRFRVFGWVMTLWLCQKLSRPLRELTCPSVAYTASLPAHNQDLLSSSGIASIHLEIIQGTAHSKAFCACTLPRNNEPESFPAPICMYPLSRPLLAACHCGDAMPLQTPARMQVRVDGSWKTRSEQWMVGRRGCCRKIRIGTILLTAVLTAGLTERRTISNSI